MVIGKDKGGINGLGNSKKMLRKTKKAVSKP